MNQSTLKSVPTAAIAEKLDAQFEELAGWWLPHSYSTVEAETTVARQGVGISDASANGKVRIEGRLTASAVRATFGTPELSTGHGAIAGPDADQFLLFRLRTDLFFASTAPGGEDQVVQALSTAGSGDADRRQSELLTVTDLTHGRAELWLVGPSSAELLSHLCALDFHPSRFPDMTAKAGLVAKTRQLIVRRDLGQLPLYALIGPRSLAAYLWQTVMEAGQGLGITPIGRAALAEL